MPTVLAAAAQFGVRGTESPAALEQLPGLAERIRSLRLAAGHAMGLGDVRETTVPKITLVSPAHAGGTVATRSFIPVRCHESIGVLCAVGTAVAACTEGAVVREVAEPHHGGRVRLEHPTGHLDVELELDQTADLPVVRRAGIIRTTRKLFDGVVFARSD
jgi:4-oxalomesaconate tautomerase